VTRPAEQVPNRRAAAKARTREALLLAAEEVFADRGYGDASVDEIARVAGVSVGSVYVHFENKQALFAALITRQAEADAERGVSAASEGRARALARFDEQVCTLADSQRLALLDAETWLYAVRHPEFADTLADQERRTLARAADLVSVEDLDPEVRALLTDAEIATVAAALFHGLVRRRRVNREAVPADLFSRTLRLLLRLPEEPAGPDAGTDLR
jgi:AcrR family transcriptional regulator